MKLLTNFKESIAGLIVNWKLRKYVTQPVTFNRFVSDSVDFLVLMPNEEKDFHNSEILINYLKENKKNISLFVAEHKIGLIQSNEKYNIIPFEMNEISRYGLPTASIVRKFSDRSFDILIDLNLGNNLFFSMISTIVKAKYKIGFSKTNSDKYYNFQVSNDKINSDMSYRNLLNSLQMF